MPVHQWMADFCLPQFTVASCAWLTSVYRGSLLLFVQLCRQESWVVMNLYSVK